MSTVEANPYAELLGLFENLSLELFAAQDEGLPCGGERLPKVADILNDLVSAARKLPDCYPSKRELSVYLIGAANELRKQIGILEYRSAGSAEVRIAFAMDIICELLPKHHSAFSRFCADLEYESGETDEEHVQPNEKAIRVHPEVEALRLIVEHLLKHPAYLGVSNASEITGSTLNRFFSDNIVCVRKVTGLDDLGKEKIEKALKFVKSAGFESRKPAIGDERLGEIHQQFKLNDLFRNLRESSR